MSADRCGVPAGLLLALAVSAAVLAPTAAAQPAPGIEACAVPAPEIRTSVEAKTDWMRVFFRGLFELKSDAPAAEPPPPELFFTNISDYSSRPVCDVATGRATNYLSHLYYPIGLVVRKLGEVRHASTDYWLVETEYALRTYIRKAHLSPMEENSVYLFANGVSKPKRYCPGQGAPDCTPASYVEGRQIAPQTRYAVATRADFAASHAVEDVNYIGAPSDRRCGVVRVDVHGRSNRRDAAPILQERARLNTCVDEGVPLDPHERMVSSGQQFLDPTLKIVRLADYEAYFDKKVASSLLRMDRGMIGRLAPEFETQKKCNTVLKFETGTSYSIQGGVGIKFLSALEIGGDAAKKSVHSFQEQLGADVAIQLLSYDLATENDQGAVLGAPILIRFGCDTRNSAPQTAHEIRITHPSIAVANDFVISFRPVQAGAPPPDDALAISSEGKSGLFDQGYVFRIRGPADYFPVRDKILALIQLDYRNKLQELYFDPDDRLYFHRLASFITHLVIASAGSPAPSN